MNQLNKEYIHLLLHSGVNYFQNENPNLIYFHGNAELVSEYDEFAKIYKNLGNVFRIKKDFKKAIENFHVQKRIISCGITNSYRSKTPI